MAREAALVLPGVLRGPLERGLRRLLHPPGDAAVDFSRPAGAQALLAPESVSWRLFKNPLTVFIGGVAAVVLELAEPRVRTGVWEHTSFRERPLQRMRATGLAAMNTVYGPCEDARAAIEAVTRRHARVRGHTPDGRPYVATDPALLAWVHATASFGFVAAYEAYAAPLAEAERDRFYAEGCGLARLYGTEEVPSSDAARRAMFDDWLPRLDASPIVFEFLQIVQRMPVLPVPLRPLQGWFVRAAVELVPAAVRERLGLGARFGLRRWQRPIVATLARMADRIVLASNPAVQACRRLGLPDDFLYRRPIS